MIDACLFRDVLGAYPTGVCVVTALAEDGARHGLVVGSFTSISLDPPLVGFFPDKRSGTWPRIEATGRFCVNVLGADQLALCRRFAARADDKFAELAHGQSPAGLPVLDNHGGVDAATHVEPCVIRRSALAGERGADRRDR